MKRRKHYFLKKGKERKERRHPFSCNTSINNNKQQKRTQILPFIKVEPKKKEKVLHCEKVIKEKKRTVFLCQ